MRSGTSPWLTLRSIVTAPARAKSKTVEFLTRRPFSHLTTAETGSNVGFFATLFKAVTQSSQPQWARQSRTAILGKTAWSRPPARANFHLRGMRPRTTLSPGNFSRPTMGLNSARNFSTSYGAFDNVISNVPLGLRALGNLDVVDQRKWRKVNHDIRRANLKKVKGQGILNVAAIPPFDMAKEFSQYFPNAQVQQETVFSSSSSAAAAVVLVISLEPESAVSMMEQTMIPSRPGEYRLLTPSVLSALSGISGLYQDHSHKLARITNKLQRAGFDQDPNVWIEFNFLSDGYKEAKLFFGAPWTKAKLVNIIGDGGTASWYHIIECEENYMEGDPLSLSRQVTQESDISQSHIWSDNEHNGTEHGESWELAPSTESVISFTTQVHDDLTSTFVFPSADTHTVVDTPSDAIYTQGHDAMVLSYMSGELMDGDSQTVWEDATPQISGEYREEVLQFLLECDAKQQARTFV